MKLIKLNEFEDLNNLKSYYALFCYDAIKKFKTN